MGFQLVCRKEVESRLVCESSSVCLWGYGFCSEWLWVVS